MVDWNVQLKLGIAGLAVAVLCAAWFVTRAVLRQGVPSPWLVGLGVLFFLSVVTTLGSQVTISTRHLSSFGEDEAP